MAFRMPSALDLHALRRATLERGAALAKRRATVLRTVVSLRTLEPAPSACVAPYVSALSALHRHLCPRQVLGVRMALAAGETLGLTLPSADKRLLVFTESDGCFADGLMVASGCSMGHRTLRLADHGKIAATFADTRTQRAFRFVPRATIRQAALEYAPSASSRWHAQRDGYARMPAEQLFSVTAVCLLDDSASVLGTRSQPAICDDCGEEVINQRVTLSGGQTRCRACSGQAYFKPMV